jgi:hypothetical protein
MVAKKRKEFSKQVEDSVLMKCRRHCCVCFKQCGTKIEIHHINGNDDNSEENAVPVCFDCHAEIMSYNSNHPKGRKFTPTELKKLKEGIFSRVATQLQNHTKAKNEEYITIPDSSKNSIDIYSDYQAELVSQSFINKNVMLNEIFTLMIIWRNTGTMMWSKKFA